MNYLSIFKLSLRSENLKNILLILMLIFIYSDNNFAQTYTNTQGYNIPDSQSSCQQGISGVEVNSFIYVPLIDTIIHPQKVTISIDIFHTWLGDLSIELVKPDGSSCHLVMRVGTTACGSYSNFNGIYSFNSTNTTVIPTGTTDFNVPSGNYAPSTGSSYTSYLCDMETFLNSTIVTGNWKLRIKDYGNFDLGTLRNWTIFFEPGTFSCQPQTIPIATTDFTKVHNISSNNYFFDSLNCNSLVCKVAPNGALPITGIVTFVVKIKSAQESFVKRHYDIKPTSNISNATGRVTLYFTQAEFEDFDSLNIIKMPANNGDIQGKSNIRIGRYVAESYSGDKHPATYSAPVEIINPEDYDIYFSNNRWHVEFNTTGFGGFTLQTEINPLSFIYTMNKGGTYTQNSRWINSRHPPEIPVSGSEIYINPSGGNNVCMHQGLLVIPLNVLFNVMAGKVLEISP